MQCVTRITDLCDHSDRRVQLGATVRIQTNSRLCKRDAGNWIEIASSRGGLTMARGKDPTTVNLWFLGFVFFVVFAGLACPPRANAQATATINGTVRDSTGAVIPDATV